ncbi:MAG TPA: mechanosensitive ion channel domain-containing protein [Candidatus Acidoferrales bacterium]|nr:mechanosensitive ion channel domain-containing protein [Candidatus Acidoferrales bacterium]
MLPNIILAAAVFIVFAIAARIGKWLISRLGKKKRIRQNAATLLGKLMQLAILMIGFLTAMSVVAPSFRLGDLVKILGIGGVAIGFAFKDILQNFLAGILLLIHEPFQIGEQINVTGLEGAVNEIQSRATVVITPDGDHVVIPNATLFTNPVTVRKEKTGVLKPQKPEQEQPGSSTEQGSETKAESGEAKK